MPMISLQLPKKTKKELEADCGCAPMPEDQPKYGYGTRLEFDTEIYDKIPGIALLNVGDEVMIVGKAKVIEKRIIERQEGKDATRSLELQVTDIEIQGDPASEMAGAFAKAVEKKAT